MSVNPHLQHQQDTTNLLKNATQEKKVLMILDHSEGASKVRETRKRTETHKLIRNRIVSLKSVAKPPRVAKQILHFVN